MLIMISLDRMIELYSKLNYFNPKHISRLDQLVSMMKSVMQSHNSFIEREVLYDDTTAFWVNKVGSYPIGCRCELCSFVKEQQWDD